MEYIFEFILDLALEIGMEASTNKRVPKWVRYILITIISLLFIFVIGIIFFTGIIILNKNFLAGLFFIIIGIILLIASIIKFKNMYLIKTNKDN